MNHDASVKLTRILASRSVKRREDEVFVLGDLNRGRYVLVPIIKATYKKLGAALKNLSHFSGSDGSVLHRSLLVL